MKETSVKKATYSIIPYTLHSEKRKTIETIKRLVVTKNWVGR